MKNIRFALPLAAISALTALLASSTATQAAATVVTFANPSDITDNFRELRAAAVDMTHNAANGSDGVNSGYATFTTLASPTDSTVVRYAFDANGAAAGSSTFLTGFAAMDINYGTANKNLGLFFAPTTADSIGWLFRVDNSGTLENSQVRYGSSQLNNFENGTILGTATATAFINGSSTTGAGTGTALNTFPNTTLTANNWYSMRLDFGLDGLNQRTFEIRVWDNILDGNGVGTGTLRFEQSFTISGSAYNTAGEVGIYTPGATSTTFSIDNFSVQAVPEPSTFALAGLGLAGLLIFRQRS